MDTQILSAKRQNLFFQHLLALGFDVQAMSKEYRTNFEKKMFCLPNRTAFEVVSYFLFSKLNEVSEKQYQIIWPLLDIHHHKEFQKTCFRHLTAIAEESEIIFPRVNSTVLSSYGEAFYELYFAFSTHVVMVTNRSFNLPMLKRTQENNPNREKIIEILKINTISSIEKFQQLAKISHFSLKNHFNCANNLIAFIEKVKSSNASKQPLLEVKMKELISLYFHTNFPPNITFEKAFEKSYEYVRKVTQYWKCLEDFFTKEAKFWNCISSEIDEKHVKYILKGDEYKIPVPNVLKETYDAETLKAVSLTEHNELCILRFLKLFKMSSEIYINILKKSQLSNLYLTETLKDTSKLEDCLEQLQSFSETLRTNNELSKNSYEEYMANMDIPRVFENEMDLKDFLPSLSNLHQSCKVNEFISVFDTPLAIVASDIDVIKTSQNDEENIYVCSDAIKIKEENLSNSLCSSLEKSCLNSSLVSSNHLKEDSCSFLDEQRAESNLPEEKSLEIQPLSIGNAFSVESFAQHFDESEKLQFGTSTKFILRESWLLEESLNSQTLNENDVFLD